jgi:hypothetical protein
VTDAKVERQRLGSAWRVVLGLLPQWILLIRFIVAPGSIDSIFANPPAVAGLPGGVVLVAAALAVMAIGVDILRRTSSNTTALLAFAFLTVPSAAVMIVAPTLVLMGI